MLFQLEVSAARCTMSFLWFFRAIGVITAVTNYIFHPLMQIIALYVKAWMQKGISEPLKEKCCGHSSSEWCCFLPQIFEECNGFLLSSESQAYQEVVPRLLGPLLSLSHRASVPASIFWTGGPTCQAPLLNQLSLPVSKLEFREYSKGTEPL